MEHVLKLHEYAVWSKFDKVFLKYIATNFENMLKEERVGEKHDLKKILCRVPLGLALGKCGFAECPLGRHSATIFLLF
jgi:hypothetical protein